MREQVLAVSRVGYDAGGLSALLSVRVRPGVSTGVYVDDAETALRELSAGRPTASGDGLLVLRACRRGGVVAVRLCHGTTPVAALLVPIDRWELDLRRADAVLHDARLVLCEPAGGLSGRSGQPAAS